MAGRGGKTDSDATTDDLAPLNAAAPPLTDSKFYQKYNSYRGKVVPTVSETMAKFNELFPRPVPSVYRNIISEILMTTHLAKHCAMWKYVGSIAVLCLTVTVLVVQHEFVLDGAFSVCPSLATAPSHTFSHRLCTTTLSPARDACIIFGCPYHGELGTGLGCYM